MIPIKPEHIFEASKFKLNNITLNISYADAMGYAIADARKMKFLTGDEAFEHQKNVEFVK